jgi:hypothetical protein
MNVKDSKQAEENECQLSSNARNIEVISIIGRGKKAGRIMPNDE